MSDEAFNLDWSEEERALWDAGRAELPETSAETKLLASLGLFSPDPGGGEPKSGRVTRPETGLVAPKALVPIALALGLGALGGALFWVNHPADSLRARAIEKPKATLASGPSFDTGAPAELRVGPTKESPASGERASSGPSFALSAKVLPTSEKSAESKEEATVSLGDELAMIKRARALLASGDSLGAEAVLDEYRVKVKKPRLGSEALFVRVEILVARGNRPKALELAKPLRATDSPYRSRVDALLGGR